MAYALLLAAGLVWGTALAEGPGSRLGPREGPRVPDRTEREHLKHCRTLEGAEQRRCLREARTIDQPGKLSGPESTGTASGAGGGATSGVGSGGAR